MRELTKGDVPTAILEVLAQGPCHGYAIAREIERRSGDLLKMREGTLYPALRVLERDGFIEGAWEIQSSGPARKNYRLTDKGKAELENRKQAWRQYTQLFSRILGGDDDARQTA